MPNRASAKQHRKHTRRNHAFQAAVGMEKDPIKKPYRGFGSAWLKKLEEMESLVETGAHPPEQMQKGGDDGR